MANGTPIARISLVRKCVPKEATDTMAETPESKVRRIQLGRVFITRNVLDECSDLMAELHRFLSQHLQCCWGQALDLEANEMALVHGGRVLSVWTTSKGHEIWILTEGLLRGGMKGEHTLSTILFPRDY